MSEDTTQNPERIMRRYVTVYTMSCKTNGALSSMLGFVEADTFDSVEQYVRTTQAGRMIAEFVLDRGGITDCGVTIVHCASKQVRSFNMFGNTFTTDLKGKV